MKKLLWTIFTASLFLVASCANRAPVTAMHPPINPSPVAHCNSVAGLPDSTCTPGVVRTSERNSICHGGSTRKFRPPLSYTEPLKKQGILEYGYTDTKLGDYEEDHLISLELGGDGFDPKNLWPETHADPFGSFQKDKVENWLHKQICSGAISVADAQRGVATNWKQYLPAANGVRLSKKERQ